MGEFNQVQRINCVIHEVEHDACHVGGIYVVSIVIHGEDQGPVNRQLARATARRARERAAKTHV